MLKFYHAPWSRSSAVFWLLEELGIDYEMELVEIRAEGGAPEAYRQIQPNKKVPAIVHDGLVVTERAAIFIYLADRFPQAGLAPSLDAPERARYLTALVHHDAVFDPAISARVNKLHYVSTDYPFGLYEDLVAHLEKTLAKQPFAAGPDFTAADILLATGISYTMNVLKALPELEVFRDYVTRATERPAYKRTQEKDAALASNIPALQAMMAKAAG